MGRSNCVHTLPYDSEIVRDGVHKIFRSPNECGSVGRGVVEGVLDKRLFTYPRAIIEGSASITSSSRLLLADVRHWRRTLLAGYLRMSLALFLPSYGADRRRDCQRVQSAFFCVLLDSLASVLEWILHQERCVSVCGDLHDGQHLRLLEEVVWLYGQPFRFNSVNDDKDSNGRKVGVLS